MNYKVSIIVPTIGRETIVETIESIINQTYKNIEIIVSDDTVEMKAKPLIEKYLAIPELDIKYTVNTKYEHGPAGNKNNGLDNASGDLITILDDDDYLISNDVISKSVELFYKLELDILVASYIDGNTGKPGARSYGRSEFLKYEDFVSGRYENNYFCVFKRSLLNDNRFYSKLWAFEIILVLKLLKRATKVYYLNEPMYYYRQNNEDKVILNLHKQKEKLMLGYKCLINEFKEDFMIHNPKQIVRFSLNGIYYAKLSGRYKEMVWFLRQSFISLPYGILATTYFVLNLLTPTSFLIFLRNKILSSKFGDFLRDLFRSKK